MGAKVGGGTRMGAKVGGGSKELGWKQKGQGRSKELVW